VVSVVVNGPASWNQLVRLAVLPEGGAGTVSAVGHDEQLGGTSAGKAVTLAALGVDVLLHTVLGDDEAGDRVRRALDRPHLDLVASPARDGRTERHLNLMAADGSRFSIYLELPQPAGPPPERVLAAIASARVAVLDLAEHSRPLLSVARAAATPIWCDVHDDDGVAEYPRAFADAADVLLVSAARLADPAAYLRERVEAGCRLAVCTRGADGALALDAEGWWEVQAAPAEAVVDTNGAGDAFLAGLLAAHLDGLPTPAALAVASATGALAVTGPELGAPHADRAGVDALAARVAVRRG